ncbi:putative histidine kinase [Calothrix sp. NIES-2100]|uniref:ATP-binding protein n=1 Tax=Calothrix sp. NIES-2100 TaxID=1954172 RepID=UPI000B5E9A61|nr:putative histidine kinase [Calothrix sp. NIES-2100]
MFSESDRTGVNNPKSSSMLLPPFSMQVSVPNGISEFELTTNLVKVLLIDNQIIIGEAIHRILASEADISISYQIIERHKGTIHAKSQTGVGTEFVIEIPIALVE